MASSQSSKYPVEHRRQLYFNKYRYRITFTVQGASRTRYTRDITEFDKRIEDSLSSTNFTEAKRLLNIDRDKIQDLLDLRDLTKEYSTMTLYYNSDEVNLYTNNESVIGETERFQFDNIKVKEAVASIPLDVMQFARTPPATFRVYFKEKRVDDVFKDKISKFLANYPDIRPSDSMKNWLRNKSKAWYRNELRASHYVDFDHDSLYTILIMSMPDNCIRKHFRLEKK